MTSPLSPQNLLEKVILTRHKKCPSFRVTPRVGLYEKACILKSKVRPSSDLASK